VKPEDIGLHDVETFKGNWGTFVQSVVKAQGNDNLFLAIILEQNVDYERFRMRKLEILVFAPELARPAGLNGILGQIRNWIETTEGDGFLDLASRSV